MIDCGPNHAQDEVGGALYDVVPLSDGLVRLTFGRDVSTKSWLSEGALLWRTSDAQVDAKLKKLASSSSVKRTAVDVAVSVRDGRLTVRLTDSKHTVVEEVVVEPPATQPLTQQTIVKAVGSLGDTPWKLGDVSVDIEGAWWCYAGEIKSARRRAVESLKKLRAPTQRSSTMNYGAARQKRNDAGADGGLNDDDLLEVQEVTPRVSVLVRDPAQCHAVCAFASSSELVDEVVLDFLEMTNYQASIDTVREHGLRAVVAAPRITLPGERGLDGLISLKPDALLARSPGQLQSLNRGHGGVEIRGDFSLNAANAVSFAAYADEGLERLTPAHDLSGSAIASLARSLSPNRRMKLEPVLHQHLPIFHSSHCLYARYLSKGNSYQDCGHVCERHKIHLQDENGQDHLVLADMGCRNTVFNAQAQSGADTLAAWLEEGISRYRIEFVDEGSESVRNVLGAYSHLFEAKGRAPEPLWSLLSGVEDSNGHAQGASVGSLRSEKERKAGKGRKTTGQRRSKVVVRRGSDAKTPARKKAKSR